MEKQQERALLIGLNITTNVKKLDDIDINESEDSYRMKITNKDFISEIMEKAYNGHYTSNENPVFELNKNKFQNSFVEFECGRGSNDLQIKTKN